MSAPPVPEVRAVVDGEAIRSWLSLFATEVARNRDLLTQLDSAIGDADHGANLDRGTSAAVSAFGTADHSSPGSVLKTMGMTLVGTVGGASGPLYGTLFLRMAGCAGDAERLDAPAFAAALRAGLDGVVARGRAQAGDKTMYDALSPACDALDDALAAGRDIGDALSLATAAADAGRDATIPMLARKGRASYLGERSVGHQDPGATSAALLVAAAAQALSGQVSA
ncbi:dihydroxyacetone kinase subunit DhaL [Kribbella caucasensis]|uniref:dihydroxyacetone kinase subunit DhaL n=1 Tax=Kribbella caucasensis TaxID=2512215 RepID=UPI00351A6C50